MVLQHGHVLFRPPPTTALPLQGGGNSKVMGHALGAHILGALGVFDDNPQIAIHGKFIAGVD